MVDITMTDEREMNAIFGLNIEMICQVLNNRPSPAFVAEIVNQTSAVRANYESGTTLTNSLVWLFGTFTGACRQFFSAPKIKLKWEASCPRFGHMSAASHLTQVSVAGRFRAAFL